MTVLRDKTTDFYDELENSSVKIPCNCTDKLQPLDISINKSMKSELRKCFQLYYSNKVQRQLQANVPLDQVKALSAIKTKSASWIIIHNVEVFPHCSKA